jgi:hypothetical protein
MTGSNDSSRRREPVYQVARCHKCGEERAGETRFESMRFWDKPIGRPIHFCDECEADLILNERSLEEVLAEYLAADRPPLPG